MISSHRNHLVFPLCFVVFALLTGLNFAQEPTPFAADKLNRLEFTPVEAKFVRLDLVRSGDAPALDTFEVYGSETGEKNLAAAENDAKATASSCISGYAIHKIEHLVDGRYGNDSAWVADPRDQDPFVIVELPEAVMIDTVVFSRDQYGNYLDRLPREVRLSVSSDGVSYQSIEDFKLNIRPSKVSRSGVHSRWHGVHVPVVPPLGNGVWDMGNGMERNCFFPHPPSPIPHSLSPVCQAFVDEEYAWLKTFGYADTDPGLRHTPYPIKRHPERKPNDVTALNGGVGIVRVGAPGTFEQGALVEYRVEAGIHGENLHVEISTNRFLSSHLAVVQTESAGGIVAVNEVGKLVWRAYNHQTPQDVPLDNEKCSFTCTPESASMRVSLPFELIPDCENGVAVRTGIGGRYTPNEGHPVYFHPSSVVIVPGIYQAEEDAFSVEIFNHAEEERTVLGLDELPVNILPGQKTILQLKAIAGELGPEWDLVFSVVEENFEGRLHLFHYDPVGRVLKQLAEMIECADKTAEGEYRKHVNTAKQRLTELTAVHGKKSTRELLYEARQAKRELFFCDPGMEDISRILFEKRHPLHPSHNYSDYYDSQWQPGGGIYVLSVPKTDGRFTPENATLKELFRTGGMCRHPVADFEVNKIYFTNRTAHSDYWHIMEMNPDGSELRQITDGPFHDLWPCPLPDGDLAFISTRCRQKFLCWEPQASVLHRMDLQGKNIKRLSFANLTEFAPSVSRDGRILWTRSEYLDKGADYGHTLWYIHPDGAVPELTFGNTIVLPQGYANGREIPGTNEVCAVMISHFGDLNGPVAILDIDKGRLNPDAIESITPEVPWPGFWARSETFREPYPISRDLFLVSHSPRDRFGLFVIDRYGNRELVYMDEEFGSLCPIPLKSRPRPPVLSSTIDPALAQKNLGVFTLEDVYVGIDHVVPRGSAKYLRIAQEMPHFLEKYADGTYRSSYTPFLEFYASPVDLVSGPYGWTSYVAKGDLGTVEIEKDGSASFTAPSGAVLFFQLLDKDYNEIQRMRSVVQLQPGEMRSCVGCHEDRAMTPTRHHRTLASLRPPKTPVPSPWGAGPFDYQKVVQPVLDKNCVSCHGEGDKVDLRGDLDEHFTPASFKTIIRGGYVHHFHWGWNEGVPNKAQPYTFGTVQSRIWKILEDENHKTVELSQEEQRAIKCWIDLSCPLWPDYKQRTRRGDPNAHDGTVLTP